MTGQEQDSPLIFAKLGGSLITDKQHRSTPRMATLRRLAKELQAALESGQDTPIDSGESRSRRFRLVLGHGSGSFGHWEASRYGTRSGVRTDEEWHGFARVSAAALQLNRLVTESFVEAGVPVLSLQPSASALAERGSIKRLELDPLERALARGLVPLVFGDVAFDDEIGATILSTEDLFVHLARVLRPSWILLLGNAPGVLDDQRQTISEITPASYPAVQRQLGGSGYTDVTGGMADKVHRMVALVEEQPDLRVRILSGNKPGNFRQALLDPEGHPTGTLICGAT